MKYIFLDIDGVLNSAEMNKEYIKSKKSNTPDDRFIENIIDGKVVDYICVDLLRNLHDIVYKTNAKLIGVSSWFWFKDIEEYNFLFDKISQILSLPIRTTTEYTSGGIKRGAGVIKWLKENNYNPEKDNFIILDDCADFYSFKIKSIDGKVGLTKENVDYFINELNKLIGIDLKIMED